jgi:hypothetical protein
MLSCNMSATYQSVLNNHLESAQNHHLKTVRILRRTSQSRTVVVQTPLQAHTVRDFPFNLTHRKAVNIQHTLCISFSLFSMDQFGNQAQIHVFGDHWSLYASKNSSFSNAKTYFFGVATRCKLCAHEHEDVRRVFV